MKTSTLHKLIVGIIVFVGFAAITPADAARAPRNPIVAPPTPVSGL